MIRSFIRWFDRNPLVAVWAGMVVALAVLLVARAWDANETQSIRQHNPYTSRSSS
ncbi:hypothetical protein [Burkholderia territorii]|uniref:hypothetical protein n=1 Tax=Burkholderia territorii TaxID=1503055 RepID=UPI000B07C376|nr:hypothetical protein [Burkholderia territorii]